MFGGDGPFRRRAPPAFPHHDASTLLDDDGRFRRYESTGAELLLLDHDRLAESPDPMHGRSFRVVHPSGALPDHDLPASSSQTRDRLGQPARDPSSPDHDGVATPCELVHLPRHDRPGERVGSEPDDLSSVLAEREDQCLGGMPRRGFGEREGERGGAGEGDDGGDGRGCEGRSR